VGGIFISYRRDDSQAWAGRLYDALRRTFGPTRVFRDIDTLEAGVDYAEAIEQWLAKSDVVLVVIGPRWLTAADPNGRRRLDDPDDLTRLEVAAALRRGIRVVSVLVGGAAMPSGEELPDDLRALARRHAHEISDRRWDYDLEQLTAVLRRLGKSARAVSNRGRSPSYTRWGMVAGSLLAVLVVVGAYRQTVTAWLNGWLATTPAPSPSPVPPPAPVAAVQAAAKVGEVFRDCPYCPEMVVVPAGEFMMGSPDSEAGRLSDEGPQHRVRIAQPFAVGRFEVTFDEWDACVAGGGCGGYRPDDNGWGRGRQPVINVSWDDAKVYVQWLSSRTGKSYRLPSEAEWEYVARAGTTAPFWTGATISTDQANYDGRYTYDGGKNGEYRQRSIPVGSLPANQWGLHEVLGNVSEWVEDCYHNSYADAPGDGSPWSAGSCASGRVVRGGSWGNTPWLARSAFRNWLEPDFRVNYLGFRVSRALAP
jgi:formylglycine-generating enzyme required for sulfatase activity